MVLVTFDKLYDNYNILSDAKDKISEYSQEYREAILCTKGGEREKKLATQIISKFFKHFPDLQGLAVEAIFDLCEDDDAKIRIAAMKTFPLYCKENKEFVTKVADILSQLLQLQDPQEYNTASNALLQILSSNPVPVLVSIFKQIQNVDGSGLIRDKCIKFLVTKVKGLDKSVLTTEVEDVIIAETKSVLQDATAEEFVSLMPFLISTRLSRSLKGQQEIINLVGDQAELHHDFIPFEEESNNVDRLLTCIKFVLPFFSSKLESTKFVTYLCDQVLSQWDKIAEADNGDILQLIILRQLAELSTYCGKLDNPSLHVVQVYQKLKDYMPLPPENIETITMPQLNFTVVECLLYTFHRLARQCPDFLTHKAEILKDFRARLTYFSRGAQGCTKALNNLDIKDKSLTEEDLQKKKMAPKILSNINTLIKDLFYQPPKYQCTITLSFKLEEAALKKTESQVATTAQLKRHVPITFDSNGSSAGTKQPRTGSKPSDVKIYTPPSGKFSNNFPSYGSNRFQGRPRGGGGGRGRPGGRGNRNWSK